MTQEPHEIDPRNNPESRLAEESATQLGSRSSGGGPIFSDAPSADSDPSSPDGLPDSGTGAGDPLAGVLIAPADAAQAVPGDEGPEHPGQR